MTAGKWIMIMLWKLKTLLSASQWPTCSGSPRQKWLSYSCVLHFDAQKYESEKCARLQGCEAVKLPQGAQPKISPIPVLSVLTRIKYFKITMLILANTEVSLLMLILTGKVFDACNFMNTSYFENI